eukprot:264916-Ditylum_brightwellii.AAC.1
MEGNYTNEEVVALALKLFEHYKKEQDGIELGKTILIQKWKDKIKIWNEMTATSPLRQHLGYLKALQSQSLDNPKSDKGCEL